MKAPNPPGAAMLERLDAVARDAGRRAAEIEAARSLPRDLVEALIGSGVFLLSRPEAVGGNGAGLGKLVGVVERLAFHDGSTAWCVLAGLVPGLDAVRLPDHHAATVLGDPRDLVIGSREVGGRGRRMEDGSLVVSGRWGWATAAAHAGWIGVGVQVDGEGAAGEDRPADGAVAGNGGEPRPEPGQSTVVQAYLRRDQVVVLDTWYALGLRGSGSTDVLATEAVVPDGRWVTRTGGGRRGSESNGGPVDGLRPGGADPDDLLVVGVAAVALGLAARAVGDLAALGGTPLGADGPPLSTWPPARIELARVAAEVRAVRADLSTVTARFDAATGQGDIDLMGRTGAGELRSAACHGVARSVEVVERCYRLAGAGAVVHSSPLQRLLRDAEVVAQHPAVSPAALDDLGGLLFAGRDLERRGPDDGAFGGHGPDGRG